MDVRYLTNKDPEMINAVWRMVERMQDAYPYYEIGWWGFMPMFVVH